MALGQRLEHVISSISGLSLEPMLSAEQHDDPEKIIESLSAEVSQVKLRRSTSKKHLTDAKKLSQYSNKRLSIFSDSEMQRLRSAQSRSNSRDLPTEAQQGAAGAAGEVAVEGAAAVTVQGAFRARRTKRTLEANKAILAGLQSFRRREAKAKQEARAAEAVAWEAPEAVASRVIEARRNIQVLTFDLSLEVFIQFSRETPVHFKVVDQQNWFLKGLNFEIKWLQLKAEARVVLDTYRKKLQVSFRTKPKMRWDVEVAVGWLHLPDAFEDYLPARIVEAIAGQLTPENPLEIDFDPGSHILDSLFAQSEDHTMAT